ncbi:MAG TPA: hypothetical protein VGN57_04470 [Pirellulaceae bacterium]|jgi:hypothetical protein|nr:hypothetical protein [Pirellulaceae bacterium]
MSQPNEDAPGVDGDRLDIAAIHRQGPAVGTQTIGCLLAGFILLLPALAYFGLLAVLVVDTLSFDDQLFFSLPDDVQSFLIWIYSPIVYFIGPYLQG